MTKHSYPLRVLIAISTLLLMAGYAVADTLPSQLTIVKNRVTLASCSYKNGATLANLQGTGDLRISTTVSGKKRDYDLGTVKLDGLSADASGQITGGILQLPKPSSITDLAGAHINVDIMGGTLVPTSTNGNPTALFIMNAIVTYPFSNDDGTRFKANYNDASVSLAIDSTGAISLKCIGGTKNTTSDQDRNPASNSFLCSGLQIHPDTTDIAMTASETAEPKFNMICESGLASTNIPNLLTLDNEQLSLSFQNLVVDESGNVTAAGMGIPEGAQCYISLANPADFFLIASGASVAWSDGKPVAFYLKASVLMPSCIVGDKGDRIGLNDSWFDMMNGAIADPGGIAQGPSGTPPDVTEKVKRSVESVRSMHSSYARMQVRKVQMTPTLTVKPYASYSSAAMQTLMSQLNNMHFSFNGYGVDVQASDMVIDLWNGGPKNYSTATPSIISERWEGIYLRKALVTLPINAWKTNDNKPVVIPVTDCYIDSKGFSGELSATPAVLKNVTLHGFNAHLNNLHIVFGRNSVLSADCTGGTSVPGFDGELNLTITVGNTDANARLTRPSNLKAPKLGLDINAANGALTPGPDGKYSLWLNGNVAVDVPGYPSLKNTPMGYHKLGIDTNGWFVTTADDGYLNLDVPANVDFTLFKCNISSLAFRPVDGSDPKKPKWYIDFNGEMSLNSDIPVSGCVNYKSLQVVEGPQMVVRDVSVVADILHVAQVSSVLNQSKNNTYGSCLYGDADLELTFLGDPIPIKDTSDDAPKFHLCVGTGNVWAVAGEVKLPNDIPLGNTGLGLYGFSGGVAHNMKAPGGYFSTVEQLIPQPNSDAWVFMAGCKVDTLDDRELFHADGVLTIGLPDFSFDIHADGWILTDSEEKPGTATVDVLLDPSIPMFRVSADVDLGIPDKSILEVKGGVELQASPSDTHLSIGWPYPENAIGASILGGALDGFRAGASFQVPGSYKVRGGASWGWWIFNGSIDAGFDCNFGGEPWMAGYMTASGSVDFWIASFCASANLNAALYSDRLDFGGSFCASLNMPWPVPDIDVSVPFSGSIN